MATFIIGDLHGYHEVYHRLLQDAGLADGRGNWTGGTHELWLIGDLFDRGPSGIGCVELTMALQEQARQQGGNVNALLGNHEMMILCARKFGDKPMGSGMPVTEVWRMWGGNPGDLDQMQPVHADWLARLPAMAKLGDTLLLHADAMFYVELGSTVDEVNRRMTGLLESDDLASWETMLRAFSEHKAFSGLGQTGLQRASQLLRYYDARRLVHGHTPINIARPQPAQQVTTAWHYAGGSCINVDGGIYLGGPGFVHQL